MLITRTPLRISLVGGGTDMPSFYKKHTGSVVSFAIDKYVYVSVNRKFDGRVRVSYSKTENVNTVDELEHNLVRESLRMFNIKNGLEITSVADIPGNGTGLGSSSSFTVGLLKALSGGISDGNLAERAYMVEAEKCLHPVGKQDQYAAAFGGFNHFLFGKRKVEVERIKLPPGWIKEFESHALLLWTGMARDANEILKTQKRNFEEGGNIEIGKQLSGLADNFYVELLDGMKMEQLGEYLDIGWSMKKMLSKGISNLKVNEWYETAMRNGAYGGKLLGAGGGGFIFLVAPPEKHGTIVEQTGLKRVDFKIEPKGSVIIYET